VFEIVSFIETPKVRGKEKVMSFIVAILERLERWFPLETGPLEERLARRAVHYN
jgi:hypothetical protein